MTVTLPTWVKWLAWLVLAFFVITILRGFIPESSEAVSPDKPPYGTIFLSGFVFILLVFWPKAKAAKQGETPASQAGQWAWVILFGTSLGMILVWVAMALFTSDGSWGEFRDNGVRPRWAEENKVQLADPVSGARVRDCPKPVRVPLCHQMSRTRFVPYGEIVDWVSDDDDVDDVLYQRIWYAGYDKDGELITYSNGRMLKTGIDHFQLCTIDPELKGILLPLNCSSRR